jgi:hypothetical protein
MVGRYVIPTRVVVRAPLVGNSLHSRVKRERELKEMVAVHLVDGPRGRRYHAGSRALPVREIAVGVDPSFCSGIVGVPVGVCRGHDVHNAGVDQSTEPRVRSVPLRGVEFVEFR